MDGRWALLMAFLSLFDAALSNAFVVLEENDGRCRTPAGQSGQCTEIDNCAYLKSMSVADQDRFFDYIQNYPCSNNFLVCCPLDATLEAPTAQKIGRSRTLPDECGIAYPFGERVVGGNEAIKGAWPWMAMLLYTSQYDAGKVFPACGGTLITDLHVLTAAHCVKNEPKVVRLGEHEYSETTPTDGVQDREIDAVFKHEDFTAAVNGNDVAIIRLKEPVQMSVSVQPICLPVLSRRTATGQSLPFIAGWGLLRERSSGHAGVKLRQVQIPLVDNDKCAEIYTKPDETDKVFVNDKNVCAGNLTHGGVDSCQGDSGGPLMWQPVGSNRMTQLGIISWGNGCARTGYPGVYTKVESFLPWISSKIQEP